MRGQGFELLMHGSDSLTSSYRLCLIPHLHLDSPVAFAAWAAGRRYQCNSLYLDKAWSLAILLWLVGPSQLTKQLHGDHNGQSLIENATNARFLWQTELPCMKSRTLISRTCHVHLSWKLLALIDARKWYQRAQTAVLMFLVCCF